MKILIVPVLAAAVLTLFAWPAARMEPRELPIGVVGSPAAAKSLDRDAFELHSYGDESAAREAIEEREVYGAFAGRRVLLSSAASPAVAQLLTHSATEMHATSEDVVSARRGGALASSVLPLVLAGIVTGVLATSLLTLLGGSLLAGLAATVIVDGWLGVLEGHWLANAAAFSLVVLAIGATIAGLRAWLGEKGIVLGALLMVLIGNPFSGVGTAPELLPRPIGDLGQLMPPGAGGNLLRSTGFFDGAAAGGHVVVLLAWVALGLLLLVAHSARGPHKAGLSTAFALRSNV
jgi:hypothetical protein